MSEEKKAKRNPAKYLEFGVLVRSCSCPNLSFVISVSKSLRHVHLLTRLHALSCLVKRIVGNVDQTMKRAMDISNSN